MRIAIKPNKKRIRENKNRKKLTEGASNFWSMENFPLLVFDYYEDVSDQIVYELKNEHEEFKDMKYWEIQETPEYEEAWDKVKVCTLDESQIDELEKDIDEFNRNARYDDRYDDYEDAEIKVEIKPGYYQAAQIYVNDEDYLQDWQIEEINKFLKELKEKYHLTPMSIAYRFSNGETGYNIVKEDLSADRNSKENGTKKYSEKKNPALKYNNQIKEDADDDGSEWSSIKK